MDKEIPIKKKQTIKSTCHNVDTYCKGDPVSKIEKTPTKRKLKNQEPINVGPRFSNGSAYELMKATHVKRLKMLKSPCSSIITRSRSQALKLKEVSHQKETKIDKTNSQTTSNHSKSEIPNNLVKTQAEKKVKINESKHLNLSTTMKKPCSVSGPSSKINGSLTGVKESEISKLILTEAGISQTEIKILHNDPMSSKNQDSNLKKNKNKKSIACSFIDPKQIASEKTILKEELTALKIPGKNSEFLKVPEFERKTVYENLLALNEVDLVRNVEQFECPVCFLYIDIGKGAILQECLHSLCRKCLVDAIQISDDAVVKCPFRNDEYSCESYLQEREVKSLVTPEIYEKHLHQSVAVAESQAHNSFHCKTPYCAGWCFFEDAVNIFLCPVCNHSNCLACAAIHEGKDCKKYQDDLSIRCNIIEETKETRLYLQSEFQNLPEFETYSNEPQDKVEKTTDYDKLLALYDVNLVRNVEQFECSICFSDVDVGEGATLQECLHSFCRECLAGAVQFSETAVVLCPFRNDEYSCESYLHEREIKALVTPEIYEKHLQRSMALAENQAQNSFHCKTPNCPGWCLFEDTLNTFLCPVCNHNNCLTCAAIHEGKNCKQYQDDLIFRCENVDEARKTTEYLQNILDKGKAMKCPQCQIILMKKEGCDWLKCTMCHTEICWRTRGPRWGPKGVGDISGGCKCMINHVRCHPRCKNCH